MAYGPYGSAPLGSSSAPRLDNYTGFLNNNNAYVNQSDLNQLYSNIQNENWYLINRTWNREDTSYKRMYEDMSSVGLNPWTGVASGGASTSASPSSPSMDAFKALMTGYELNAKSVERENKQTNAWFSNFAKVFSAIMDPITSIFKSL